MQAEPFVMSVLKVWLEMMRKETFVSEGEIFMGFLRNVGLLRVSAEMVKV